MAVTRCPKGHYYNSDKYMQCPHCGNDAGMRMEKGVRKGFAPFSMFYDKEPRNKRRINQIEDDDITIAIPEKQVVVPGMPVEDEENDRTIGLTYEEQIQVQEPFSEHQSIRIMTSDCVRVIQPELDAKEVLSESMAATEEAVGMSFAESESDEMKTVGSIEKESREDVSDYVVGWLVCVNGPDRGYEIRIHQGKRRIKNACTIVCQDGYSFLLYADAGADVYRNGMKVSGNAVLQDSDTLLIQGYEYRFAVFDWRWQ